MIYYGIVSLSRYSSLVTGQRARGIIAICWVLSIIIGLTPMMGWHSLTASSNSTCPTGLMKCLFEEVVVMEYMVYFNFLACVMIPLLLMLAIYLCIFMAARHQLRLIEVKSVHGEKSRSTLQKEVQAAKSLAIIVGLFAACWLPLHIINCFTLFCPDCDRPLDWIMYVAIILSHGNSVVNPFIYAYRIREFRQTFRKIIHRHILGRKERFESGSINRNSTYTRNSLSFDPVTEYTSSSCGSCPPHVSPVRGGLAAVPQPPTSLAIPHFPETEQCPLEAINQTQSPVSPELQNTEQQHNHSGPEVMEESDKQNLSSTPVASPYNRQPRKSSLSGLVRVS